ncbi:MAG: ral secretion pathway protein [Bacteriovoracaceae bacterium]|nr:ral secretion pathway protein [Bacteriovoracaceae bacterium]
MKFAKFFKLFGLLFVLSTSARAQEDFIDNGDAPITPKTNGLFDDELEPLDEKEMVRPQPLPSEEPRFQNQEASPRPQNLTFPEPKKLTPSGSSGKSLPILPAGAPGKNDKVRMDFVQVEIEDIVKYFAERLHKKFIYDPTILSGKVTIISPTEVTMREAYGAFLSAMEVRGYIIYPAGAYIKIEKAANARKVPVPIYEGTTPNDDSYVTRILTLKYLLVRDISQAVRNLLSRTGGDLIEHAPTNTLIISDYAFNIRRIIRILDVLDVENFQEQVEIIPLRNAAAPDIARKVTDFFPASGGGAPGGLGIGGAPSGGRLSRSGSNDVGVIQKVVADERTNSIIILGSEHGIEQVKKFIARIDIPTEGGGGQIHVYPIQNVKAEELASTLSSLTSGRSKSPASLIPPLPGAPSNPIRSDAEVANLGDVKITADKATNALVIQSSPRDFEVLKTIIRKLDIRRRQVFIEGAILEASVNKNNTWNVSGTGPFAQTNSLNGGRDAKNNLIKSGALGSLNGLGFDSVLQNALKDPTALTGLALGFRSGGTYPVNYTDASGVAQTANLPLLSAIIQFSVSNSNVNLLSTPHILATANEDATLSIGQEIPQAGGTSTTATGIIQSNTIRLKVATELTLTPQINQGDYLTLKIKEKINDLGALNKDGSYNTIDREASTTVIVKDQQTVVIGGLMRDRQSVNISKVPLLGDIPILGWLFKSKVTVIEKVNLLLFLTPYIIKNTGDMNDQFFRKLKQREGFLKELGVSENKGVPSSGLTEEQLKMLDKEYVKSLEQKFVYPKSNREPEDELKGDDSKAKQEKVPVTEPTQPTDANKTIEPSTTETKPENSKDLMPIVQPKPEEKPTTEPSPTPTPNIEELMPLSVPTPLPLEPKPEPKINSTPMPTPSYITPETPNKIDSKKSETPTKDWILEDSPPEKSPK